MNPKPVRRCGANLRCDDVRRFFGQGLDGLRWLVDWRAENHAPTRRAFGIDGGGDDRRASALGEQRGQRRGRREPAEKWRPESVIAGVLVAQNSDRTAAAQQFTRAIEPVLTIEHLYFGARATLANIGVDPAVAQLLVNRRVPHVSEVFRQEQRKQFPVPHVAEREDDAPAGGQLARHGFQVFDGRELIDFFERHSADADAAKQVCAESLELFANERANFIGRLLVPEGNRQVMPRKTPVLPRDQPRAEAGKFADAKQQPKRQRADDRRGRAIQNVNAEIEHAGSTDAEFARGAAP